jgi:hypothetical protein
MISLSNAAFSSLGIFFTFFFKRAQPLEPACAAVVFWSI